MLAEPDRPWKPAVFMSGGSDDAGQMFRNRRYSYLEFKKRNVPAALFDLEQDPWETNNLVDDPAHAGTRRTMAALLKAGCQSTLPPATESTAAVSVGSSLLRTRRQRSRRSSSGLVGWPCSGSSEIRDARVVRRPRARGRPEEAAVLLANGDVVDARLAAPHQAPPVEFPQLVAVAAEPVPRVVVPLVPESDGDAVAR